MISQAEIKERFDYHEDGSLIYKKSYTRCAAGSVAGTVNGIRGYRVIEINGKRYKAHRLVYLWHTGELPPTLDHINRDRLDNRIENLRAATKSQNGMNSGFYSNNTSGAKGVCWHKRYSKWQVRVKLNGKDKYIGRFDDLELAEMAAIAAREKYHGEFANHFG